MIPEQFRPLIERAAAQYGVPPDLLGRLLRQESGFRPDVISGQRLSTAGAQGIAQFMPGTAKEMGVDPLNPESAIPGAARYLSQLQEQFGGDINHAVAAYNWGPGNMQKWLGSGADPSRMPDETRNYMSAILGQGGAPQAAPAAPMNVTPDAPAAGLLASAAPGLLGGQQQRGMNMAAQGLLAMNAQPAPMQAPPLPQPFRPKVDLSRLQAMLRQA